MDQDRLNQCMLLDFYGDLLTEKQRECYDLHYNEDLSLAEIAQQLGVSRQGVWDNIRRAQVSMNEIEEKTGLMKRFSKLQEGLSSLEDKLSEINDSLSTQDRKNYGELIAKINGLIKDIEIIKAEV